MHQMCHKSANYLHPPTRYIDTILELRSDGQGWVGSWTTLTAKLQHPRSWHVVIPVFTDKDDACKLIV